jgi:hypothetical protein
MNSEISEFTLKLAEPALDDRFVSIGVDRDGAFFVLLSEDGASLDFLSDMNTPA